MIIKKTTQKADVHGLSSWVLLQKWEHLLFIHLPVSSNTLASQLPKGIELDTYDRQAWISIVTFKVSKNRLRFLPSIPYLHPMLQLNVRTYVKHKGERGVYFFTMDTNKLSVVFGGKIIKSPFLHADMSLKQSADTYFLDSLRKGDFPAAFHASYTPVGDSFYLERQSLDDWLLERYVFWTYKKNHLYRGDIQHEPWKVRNAKVNIEQQNLFSFISKAGIGEKPVIHYARSKIALNGMIKKVK